MSLRAETVVRRPRRVIRALVMSSLVLAFIGLALAIIAHWTQEPGLFAEHKTVKQEVVEAAGKLVDRLRGGDSQPPSQGVSPLRLAASALGFLGVLGGAIGWIRREDHRLCAAAAAVGVAALAWQWILAGLVLAVVIAVVAGLAAMLG